LQKSWFSSNRRRRIQAI